MSQAPEERAKQIMAQAARLLDEAQGRLDEADEFYRSNGLDRAKTANFLSSRMSADEKAKLDALIKADMEDIEREVQEARTHEAASRPGGSGAGRRPRPMV
jgi:hypothetical protein